MTTIEKTPETSAHGDRAVKVRGSLIAGAQLQVALEKTARDPDSRGRQANCRS